MRVCEAAQKEFPRPARAVSFSPPRAICSSIACGASRSFPSRRWPISKRWTLRIDEPGPERSADRARRIAPPAGRTRRLAAALPRGRRPAQASKGCRGARSRGAWASPKTPSPSIWQTACVRLPIFCMASGPREERMSDPTRAMNARSTSRAAASGSSAANCWRMERRRSGRTRCLARAILAHRVAYLALERGVERADRLAALRRCHREARKACARCAWPLRLARCGRVCRHCASSARRGPRFICAIRTSDSLRHRHRAGAKRFRFADGSQIELNTDTIAAHSRDAGAAQRLARQGRGLFPGQARCRPIPSW